MIIRHATQQDLKPINDLFNWHSEHGFATFQKVSSIEERNRWFERFDDPDKHILLVADVDGAVTGVACSFSYRGGGVFENTVESSIYIHPEFKGKGFGSALYKSLFEQMRGVHRVVVGIGLPNPESIALHKKFDFKEVGIFDQYAFYKGEYRSSLWMQKKMS